MTAADSPPRTAREMLDRGRAFLERKGREEARLEAELLVARALDLDRLRLFLELDRPLTPAEVARGRELLARRGRGEPVAYITGLREFYGRDFAVGTGVLIPRPETEHLVDRAREIARASGKAPRVAEIGAGSGCIAVTLALEIEGAEVVAVERSPAALERARENAERLSAAVELLEGDGPEALAGREPFDLLVSNPPYVDPAGRDALPADVRDHEPAEALFAPPGDPDHWVRRLLAAAGDLLGADGALLVELGEGQGPRALALASAAGFQGRLHADLAGIERVLEATR